MAPAKKTDQVTLSIAESMRQVVRQGIVVDEQTGAPPLWDDLPEQAQKDIEKELRILAKQKGVDFVGKGGLRRKAQKYTQTLNERGRKVVKGKLDPDFLQLSIARKKRKFVEVDFTEKPRKVSKIRCAAPPIPAPSAENPLCSAGSPAACHDADSPFQSAPNPSPGTSANAVPSFQCPSPHSQDREPLSSPASPGATSTDALLQKKLAVKALVESLPEVTFTCSDSEHQFTLGIMIRFHRLGGDKMSDLEEEQYLVPCVVTMEKDWSQVIDVQWPEFGCVMSLAGDQLVGSLNFLHLVNSCRLSLSTAWRRTQMLHRVADAAKMSVETPVPEQVQPLIDFASKDGAFRVQLDIPDQWPLWSTPIEIISCTAANGAECFSRYLLDDLSKAVLQSSGKGCLLRKLLDGLNKAYQEKEAAKWLAPEGFYLVYPHPRSTNSITLSKEDLYMLKPGNMINDKIVNIWTREISLQCQKTASAVLVLDSFFLKKVAEEFRVDQQRNVRRLPAPMEEILRFAQVARKKLSVDDLFSYQYFVLPFCDRTHWSLLLLVNEKGLVHGRMDPVCIIHLDSLPGSRLHAGIEKYLRWILSKIWVHQKWIGKAALKDGLLPQFGPQRLPCIKASVPRQRAGSNDCGLHVLLNARTIMRSPASTVALLQEAKLPDGGEAPDSLRLFLRNFLLDLAEKQGLDIPL